MTATDSTAEPPAAEAFYDARRDVHYTKPALRGWLHLLWFEVSLVFGTLLLARTHGAMRIAASAILHALDDVVPWTQGGPPPDENALTLPTAHEHDHGPGQAAASPSP